MTQSLPLRLLHPRHWPLWLGLGLLWTATHLPYPWLMRLGAGLGRWAGGLAVRRRRVAETNLRLCFPHLSDAERAVLLQRHLESLGMSLFETALAWWASDAKLAAWGRLEGIEHLQRALAGGRGVIMLSAHLSSMDLGARYLILSGQPIHAVYRPHENPVLEYVISQARHRHADRAIHRESVREMVRSLRQGKPLWFAPDQNYGLKYSVFADFFGVPAATNTATARLAQMGGAAVVPFFVRRQPTGARPAYIAYFLPALDNFPSADPQADATRVNALIEAAVRPAPEQYLWVHRRFKDRPPGEARFY